MTRKSDFPKASVEESETPLRSQAGPARQDRNNPVAIEEFDREHMGIAAKE